MLVAYSYASVGNQHYVLGPSATEGGGIVARTMDDVLDGVATWPGNVYELRVDPRDVIEQGAHVLHVRRYDVVRAVPREKVFGRNVAALDALLAELRSFGWLRPSGEDRRPRAAVLVGEHYTALDHYVRVRAGSSRIVRDVDAIEALITSPYPVASRDGLKARAKAHGEATRAVDRRLRPALKGAVLRAVAGIAMPGAWRAAWQHVAAAHMTFAAASFRKKGRGVLLDDLGATLLERTAAALDAAMDTGLEELMAMPAGNPPAVGQQPVDATVARAHAEIPTEWGDAKETCGDVIAAVVRRVWFYSWRFTSHASSHVAWHAFHVAAGLRQPDPWAPWVGLFRIGLWPLADDGLDMTVYEPPATAE